MKKDADYSPHDLATRKAMRVPAHKAGLDVLKAKRAAVKKEISAVNSEMKARKRK